MIPHPLIKIRVILAGDSKDVYGGMVKCSGRITGGGVSLSPVASLFNFLMAGMVNGCMGVTGAMGRKRF